MDNGPVLFTMWTDLVRLAVLPYLLSAALDDSRTRLVHASVWRPPLVIASACLLADAWTGRGTVGVALLSALVLGGVSYAGWRVGALGLADVKALAVVALSFPVQPVLHPALPLLGEPSWPFPVLAVSYALICSMTWPASTALRNALSGRWSADMASVRWVSAADLPDTHGWLGETGEPMEDTELPAEGVHGVRPAIPFLVPLLAGLFLAIILGSP